MLTYLYYRYVDQGSQAMLDQSQLRHLPAQFRNTPCQAVTASLAGNTAVNGDGNTAVEGDWSPEDNFMFNSR